MRLPLLLEPLRHRDFRLLWAGQTISIFWDSALQRHVPRALLGRVNSVDGFGSIFLLPIAPLAAGAVAERFGPAAVLAGGGRSERDSAFSPSRSHPFGRCAS
jgi:hypothetical protein